MKPSVSKLVRFLTLTFLISVSFLLGACAHKAKLIQAGAAQFETESLAAIQKIDELRHKEIESAPLSKEKASDFFVNAIKNSKKPIDINTLNTLIEPTRFNTQKSDIQWQQFLQNMRLQYSTFAVTFESLDKGSLLSAPHVPETIPILDKLIAQMVATASSFENNPAVFVGERAEIAAEIEEVRAKKPFDDVTDLKLLVIERRLREVAASEEQTTKDTMKQAVKAAKLGAELRKLLINYNNLSVDDIAEGLSVAFRLAGSMPGLDISGLKTETDGIVMQINKDSDLKGFLDKSLAEINAARNKSQ